MRDNGYTTALGFRYSIKGWTVGPLRSAKWRPPIMQFIDFYQLVRRFNLPENAIDWLA